MKSTSSQWTSLSALHGGVIGSSWAATLLSTTTVIVPRAQPGGYQSTTSTSASKKINIEILSKHLRYIIKDVVTSSFCLAIMRQNSPAGIILIVHLLIKALKLNS